MSKIKFELEADIRKDIGRGASRRLRLDDKIPAVLYGAGEDAVSLTLDHNKTIHALAHEAFYSHILTLKIDKKGEKVILKAMQRHPTKPRITHIDFLRVRADQKLQMNVPLHFVGEDVAPGLDEGGVISHLMSDVAVSCLPADLPEFIEIDVSNLGLNQILHLSDIKLPNGVELIGDTEAPVVSMHVPRVEEEPVVEVAPEGEAAAPAEGEVTEESKPEEAGKENKKE